MITFQLRRAQGGRRLAQAGGTRFSMSSVVRTTTGIAISASATQPAQAEKWPMRHDHHARRRTGR